MTRKRAPSRINLEQLIEQLIADIVEVDSNDDSRSTKTRDIRRLATKFKNEIRDDKRRKKDEKIAVSTYRRYMTMARQAIARKNWRHHGLEQQITRLGKHYPQYADDLNDLLNHQLVDDLRQAWRVLMHKIKKTDNQDAFADVKALKIDHEIMRHLTVSDLEKAQLRDQQSEALEKKKNNTVTVNFSWLQNTIIDLLTRKSIPTADGYKFAQSRLALGLALATGRRSIEVVYQGSIKRIGDRVNRVEFTGQAKKRGGSRRASALQIFTLVDAGLVEKAWAELRSLPQNRDLEEQYGDLPELDRNIRIKQRVSGTLNDTIRSVFNDDERMFKDSRAIWARCVYDLYYAEWHKSHKADADVFWKEMLGHEDTETQQSYKQFIIDMDEEEQVPAKTSGDGKTRLVAMEALSDDDEISNRKAMARLHNWAIEQLKKNEDHVFTQSSVSRDHGGNRKLIKDWLAVVQEALALPAADVEVQEVPKPKVEEKPAKSEEKAAETAKKSKPRFRTKREGGEVTVEVWLDDELITEASADDLAQAQKDAWQMWLNYLEQFSQ